MNNFKRVQEDVNHFPESTIQQRAQRLKIKKWDILDILHNFSPQHIRGKGFDLKAEDLKKDMKDYPLSSIHHRARRLNVYSEVIMKVIGRGL